MRSKADAAGITFEEVWIETPDYFGIVKLYKAPLLAAYTKLHETFEHSK